MKNSYMGWATGLLALALCAVVLVLATPQAIAQSNNGRGSSLVQRVATLELLVSELQAKNDQLEQDLATERQVRADADTQLSSDLATERQVRADADTQLSSDLATERQVRADADTQLSSDLAAETQARTVADNLINSLLLNTRTRLSSVEFKTQYMSVIGTKTRFAGTNLQVVNGLSQTASINGLGNIIVGYDENESGFSKTGSHNFVGGSHNGYSSYGGFVVGKYNKSSHIYAAVSGGKENIANARYSSITGGSFNFVSGDNSTITGGDHNFVGGFAASCSGGRNNIVHGNFSQICGGRHVIERDDYAWAAGSFRYP